MGGGTTFDPATSIPPLTGKVILVTGGNVGLGYESILQLAQHQPSKIYLAARNKFKAQAAIAKLEKAMPPNGPAIEFLELDLASFASVQRAVDTFTSSSSRLDILLNNAGIMAWPESLTADGYELQFGTNHLGHALLTKLLLPTLLQTARSGHDVRIVNLSSGAHTWAPKSGIIYSTLTTSGRQISTWQRYGQSKLANIYYTRELAKRHPEIKVCAVHPGFVKTNLMAGPYASYPLFSPFVRLVSSLLQVSLQEGAKNQLWAATTAREGVTQGGFYYPIGKEFRGSQVVQSVAESAKLWEWTEKELKTHGF